MTISPSMLLAVQVTYLKSISSTVVFLSELESYFFSLCSIQREA